MFRFHTANAYTDAWWIAGVSQTSVANSSIASAMLPPSTKLTRAPPCRSLPWLSTSVASSFLRPCTRAGLRASGLPGCVSRVERLPLFSLLYMFTDWNHALFYWYIEYGSLPLARYLARESASNARAFAAKQRKTSIRQTAAVSCTVYRSDYLEQLSRASRRHLQAT